MNGECHCLTSPWCVHKDKRFEHVNICVCLKIDHISRETNDIVCSNKLSLSIHAKRKSHIAHTLGLIGILRIHSVILFLSSLPFSLLSLSLSRFRFVSMVNFEKCNEMKIVERKRRMCQSSSSQQYIWTSQTIRTTTTTCCEGKKANHDYHLSLTSSHSWTMKRPSR